MDIKEVQAISVAAGMKRRAALEPMVRKYNAMGWGTQRIGKELGIGRDMVSRIRREYGHEYAHRMIGRAPKPPKRYGHKVEPLTVALYANKGLSIAETARQMGVSPSGVARVRHLMGFPKSKIRARKLDRMEVAKILAEDGCSSGEIARTLQMKQNDIARELPNSVWDKSEGSSFISSLQRIARNARYNKEVVTELARFAQ